MFTITKVTNYVSKKIQGSSYVQSLIPVIIIKSIKDQLYRIHVVQEIIRRNFYVRIKSRLW